VEHTDFDYTRETPADISNWIQSSTLNVTVKLHKSNDPDTRTLAYRISRYPNTLFVNSRKLDRDTEDIVNTIIHESVHAVDGSLTDAKFGHGDNSSADKGNSAPYWIGSLAERIARGSGMLDDSTIQDDPIEFIEEDEDIDERLIED